MAKEIYIGSDGKSKEIKNAYIGINNLARKIKKDIRQYINIFMNM